MPGFDGTGPAGMGPMTGGGRGFCMTYLRPRYWYGLPWGAGPWGFFGRGRGRGFRHWFYATGLPRWARFYGGAGFPAAEYTPPAAAGNLVDFLKEKATFLEKMLEETKKSIRDLEERKEQKE